MTDKKAAGGAAIFNGINKLCRGKDLAKALDPEKAFEQMNDWVEKKQVARWVMIATVVYIAAQIIRAVVS